MTTTLNNFGRNEHRLISTEVIAALKEVGDKFGITFSTKGGEIGGTGGMIKLGVDIKDTAGAASRAKTMWDAYAPRLGLDKDDFGAIFVTAQGSYKITGVNPSAPKYPIEAQRVGDRKPYKFPVWTVKQGLPKKAA